MTKKIKFQIHYLKEKQKFVLSRDSVHNQVQGRASHLLEWAEVFGRIVTLTVKCIPVTKSAV